MTAYKLKIGRSKSCGCTKPSTVLPIVGQRYGRLVVKRVVHKPSDRWWVECDCDCGGEHELHIGNLRRAKSCGCLSKGRIGDYSGERFGEWAVIKRVARPDHIQNSQAYWLCRCDCGTESAVAGPALRRGHSLSCGCNLAGRIGRASIHGMTGSPEWYCWDSVLSRCYNPNDASFSRYGGKGIEVCERWQRGPAGFLNFYEDMGARPADKDSIDRIDNTGHYTPNNCRWATHQEQANNRSSNRLLTYNGETRTVMEWSRLKRISRSTLSGRIDRGWSVEKALTTPVRKQKNNRKMVNIANLT